MKYVDDPDFTLYNGDVRETLAGLPDESVHCVVTSPPYWGLRDYGTGSWDGGDPDCDHTMPCRVDKEKATATSTLVGSTDTQGHLQEPSYRDVCGKCGARRVDHQLGLEPTPDLYVQHMVAVFREVRRVLRKDGTCWLNIGDSYAGGGRARGKDRDGTYGESKQGTNAGTNFLDAAPVPLGLKHKDLVGVPWRVAFALQADGWYLRADIIWAKPNPMPESVTDRPTKAHEYVFLLTRSPRYFFYQDAVREAAVGPDRGPGMTRGVNGPHAEQAGLDRRARRTKALVPSQTVAGVGRQGLNSETFGEYTVDGGRNVRSVWEIATQPYAEAHFATFPEALVERCVKAGSPLGGTILDPFMGSGTTALVARRLGRKAIGVELNPDYCALAARRLQQLSLLAV